MFTIDTYEKGDAIAFSWHIDDVKSIDSSLTDEQAREVLSNFNSYHDGSQEAMWEDLKINVNWYKEKLNEKI